MTNRQVCGILASMGQILDEIRTAIAAGHRSRYRIAKDLDISQAQLSRVMSGERGLSIDTLERLSDYLGLEIVIRPKRRRTKKG